MPGAAEDFEDYSCVSSIFDRSRRATGLKFIRSGLRQCATASPVVVDLGCGTGNLLTALKGSFSCAIGIDKSIEMVRLARKKDIPRTWFSTGDVTRIPLQACCADLVLSTFVIHHFALERQVELCTRFLLEAARLMTPGGVFVLGTTAANQYEDGFWWSSFLPQAVERVKLLLPIKSLDSGWFHRLAEGAGLEAISSAINYEETLQHQPQYLSIESYLDPGFRRGISTWSLASPAESSMALARMRKLLEDPGRESFFEEREQARVKTGQSVFITYRKRKR